MASFLGRVMVYGGKGALGSTIVNYFRARNWWVGCIDMVKNEDAHVNVIVKFGNTLTEQETSITEGLKEVLKDDKLDALICVAGGWAGGNAASNDLVKKTELMIQQSLWTSVITAKLGALFLKEEGIVSLTGAKAALGPTPNMIGYGVAKAAVHQLIRSLTGPNSGLPKNATAVGILPETLDTPTNRKFMPTGDPAQWTPLSFVAELLYKWAVGEERPVPGSLITLVTRESQTKLEVV